MTSLPASQERSISRIDFLEGLRGFLAVYVMFAHIGLFVGLSRLDKLTDIPFPGTAAFILTYFDHSSSDAVNMFMILSGFVIFHLLSKGRETYMAYIIRRFFRLWPIFILAILFGVLINKFYLDSLTQNPWAPHNSWILKQLENVRQVQKNMLPYFLCDLPMLHGIVPAFILERASSAFSSLAWCISTEWQFYLCAPFFFRLTKSAIGTVLLTAFVIFSLGWEHIYDFSVNPAWSLLPLQLHWFFLGMICYRIYQDIEANGLNRRNRFKIVSVVMFTLGLSLFKPRLAPAACAWLFVLVTLVDSLTGRNRLVSRMVTGFFDNPVSRYFGRISYPVYLVHWPISILVLRSLVQWYPGSSWQAAYVILIVVVPLLTWAIAHLAHHYLEVPAMDLGKRIASRFPRRGAAAQATPLPARSKTNQPA
jgi:peptidoglycan/LPS O-acetylase OafA/YrhL